jgi:hypothetical protein
MTTLANLLAQKQQLTDRLQQENLGPQERKEIERLLDKIDTALSFLEETGPGKRERRAIDRNAHTPRPIPALHTGVATSSHQIPNQNRLGSMTTGPCDEIRRAQPIRQSRGRSTQAGRTDQRR